MTTCNKFFFLKQELREKVRLHIRCVFRRILSDLDQPTCISALESYDSFSKLSIFEVACNEEYASDFIKDCISVGCDVNRVCYISFINSNLNLKKIYFQRNPKWGRRPINIAIEGLYFKNLKTLLSESTVCLDFEHSFDFPFTPINYLIELISDVNFLRVFL